MRELFKTKSLSLVEKIIDKKDKDRIVYIDSISSEKAKELLEKVYYWNAKDRDILTLESQAKKPIRILINAFDGDMKSMFTMINILKMSKTPIYTYNIGMCGKEAFFVYLMGEKRFAYPHTTTIFSRMMITEDFKSNQERNNYSRQLLELKNILIDKTIVNEGQYNKHSDNDWYLDTEELLKNKIALFITTPGQLD